MIKSAYIHIPFCTNICSYCDFCKMYYDEELVSKYLNALDDEIKKNYKDEILDTLYIGGGSPSSLNIEQLNMLFSIIKRFKLSNDYEFSFEFNINDITIEKLECLLKNGVNRVSIGIETINDKFYKFLNRYNSTNEIKNKIDLVKKYFSNINIDLMYAFPNETLKDLNNDIDFVLSLNPSHISLYSLIIEEHTKLYIDGVMPIDEELDEEMYSNIINKLKENGYIHYEISNFCKIGYESRHNMCYWNNNKYYGFGLGASGYIDDYRYCNTRNINKYINGNCILNKDVIDKNLDMENYMMLGLRKVSGINKKDFFNRYSFDVEQIFDIINLVNNKLLVYDNDNIKIPEDKLYVSNSILVNFIGGCSDGK